ncbi:MAG: T9SS type A sorting domain-containing protein [Ferruginibacter sp.]|nr:T9SS type A sorting domain-containing protein [Ferruginibacter sp.]
MKKKFTLFVGIIILICLQAKKLSAQCSFISPTVQINNIQSSTGGNCEITMNLSFNIITNSGNKIVFIHLWRQPDYPNLNYGCNQCQPSATDLSATIANFVINNFGTSPVFETTYGPANSVVVKTPTNNPGLSIAKYTSSVAGADSIVVSNVKITIPGACTNSFSFQGDSWSSNANNNNPVVHCAMEGFVIGGTDPNVSLTRTCASYNLTVSTISTTRDIYYDIFMDDGDGVYEGTAGATPDILITTIGSGSAISVTPGTPYTTGPILLNAPYNSSPYTLRKMYAAVSTIGQSFISLSESNNMGSCGLAPITLSDFYAQRKNSSLVQLSWKTSTEINAKGFDIERKTDNGFVKVGFVAATNIASGASYSYQDNNTYKAVSQYRIKMVDKDNTYKLSETRSIKGNTTVNDFTVFPNPSSGSTKISISDLSEPTDVQLIDNSGKIIKTLVMTTTNSIELTNLQKGLYLIRLRNRVTGDIATKKLSVVK